MSYERCAIYEKVKWMDDTMQAKMNECSGGGIAVGRGGRSTRTDVNAGKL